MLIRGTVSPSGISSLAPGIQFRFIRTKEKCSWRKWPDGWARVGNYQPPGTEDGPDPREQDITPSSEDHIYAMDAPGIDGTVDICTEMVHRVHLTQYVEMLLPGPGEEWRRCSDNVEWHSYVWIVKRGPPNNDWARRISGNSVGPGFPETVGNDQSPPGE